MLYLYKLYLLHMNWHRILNRFVVLLCFILFLSEKKNVVVMILEIAVISDEGRGVADEHGKSIWCRCFGVGCEGIGCPWERRSFPNWRHLELAPSRPEVGVEKFRKRFPDLWAAFFGSEVIMFCQGLDAGHLSPPWPWGGGATQTGSGRGWWGKRTWQPYRPTFEKRRPLSNYSFPWAI
jgi:hypothetical protein